MDDIELACLFAGYGYQVRIVEYGADHSDHERDIAVNYDMAVSMEWCLSEIRKIQQAARGGKPIVKPRWPMIVMRTPKGWTGPRALNGNVIEGNWRAHQGEWFCNSDRGAEG
jgi:xylulose-5-phosphate/fructose-6-phosphate phosphoketolase